MVARDHGLVPSRAEVDDNQAPMPNAHITLYLHQASMGNGISHFFENDRRNWLTVQMDEAGDTVH